ncbi:YcaO-like family protein, partial [Bdellovibrionales bacterium]|nr:YcaO-like family protein [Bdellovibrionales bacterium]
MRELLFPIVAPFQFSNYLRRIDRYLAAPPFFARESYADALGSDWIASVNIDVQITPDTKALSVGSGEAKSLRKAKAIAIAETVERVSHHYSKLLIQKNNIPGISLTSNGCAFHPSHFKSLYNSTCELLERDLFLCHWYGSRKLPYYTTEGLCDLTNIDSFVTENEGNLRIHTWFDKKYECYSVVLVAHFPERSKSGKMNFFCGLGGGPQFSQALAAAKKEIIRFLRVYWSRPVNIIEQTEKYRRGSSHGRLYYYQLPEVQKCYLDRLVKIKDKIDIVTVNKSNKKWLKWLLNEYSDEFILEYLPVPADFINLGYSVRMFNSNLQYLDAEDDPHLNSNR